jgi:hypothetical protein
MSHDVARILVCGGRNYTDRERVFAVLDRFHKEVPIGTLIHGAASGADTLAGEWAAAHPSVAVRAFPARWVSEGRIAGTLRNARMLREADPHAVIAFPGGAGTADMVRRAMKAGVRVLQMA